MALKAATFGAAWFFLPFWAFVLIALYFYFVPLFRPFQLALPFLVVLFFAAVLPASAWFAILFAVFFYLILGVKNLIFISRKSAYEILVLLITALVFLRFFSRYDSWDAPGTSLAVFLAGAAFFLLCRGFLKYTYAGATEAPGGPGVDLRRAKIALGVASLILTELALVAIFLPINFLYQATLIFISAAILLEFTLDYADGVLARKRILTGFSIFFIFLVIILGSAQWSL